MLRTFKSKALAELWSKGTTKRIDIRLQARILIRLDALDASRTAEDMNLPGFRFHALVGRDKGRYAANASGNWRITFGWTEGDAIDVDLEDYH